MEFQFSDRLDKGENECDDVVLPNDADVVRKVLQQHHDTKKGSLNMLIYFALNKYCTKIYLNIDYDLILEIYVVLI